MDNYPKVLIELPSQDAKEVNAEDLFHIPLNDEYLDSVADKIEVSVTAPKCWIFNRGLPQQLYQCGDKGIYYLTNPIANETGFGSIPINTVDSLEHTLSIVSKNTRTINLYKRLNTKTK